MITYQNVVVIAGADNKQVTKGQEILQQDLSSISSSSSIQVKMGIETTTAHLIHRKYSSTGTHEGGRGTMQKSKSSSNVIQQSGRLMAKKIFRTGRSKSQTRIGGPGTATTCSWSPQGNCTWTNLHNGKRIILTDTALMHISDIERKILQKVALAKLQALNLGAHIKLPPDNLASASITKSKRISYLLKKKPTTISFDRRISSGADSSGLVFGVPLTQCIENERITSKLTFRSHGEISIGGSQDNSSSRTSFSSLNDSCENLLLKNRSGLGSSVPGLLDTISCSSGMDQESSPYVPQILNTCFRYLERYGLRTLGIFRISTSRKRIKQLRDDFDAGREINLDNEQSPHDVATLLKEYLRELPDPLLCRDLYQAFLQTQRISNQKLQLEALQHLIQLLPPANRDTLYALLRFLALVAENSDDSKTASGEDVAGNKMDSNNLATVFAPNILHCIKNTSGTNKENHLEDRNDVINTVKILIEHYKSLFTVSAEQLDQVYVTMMDSQPDALQKLFQKQSEGILLTAEESLDEVDNSETTSLAASPTTPEIETFPKRTYSREECLHEAAATGGPDMGMIFRYTSAKHSSGKKSTKSTGQHTMSIFAKNRSSSLESNPVAATTTKFLKSKEDEERRKSSPYVLEDNIIKASLTIPFNFDNIPYIEDTVVEDRDRKVSFGSKPDLPPARERFTPTITSIGTAVLRSKTEDFEQRISNKDTRKKYTKRRYTDTRHQTRHIPDAATLDATSAERRDSTSGTATIYKRRELISSAPASK